MKILALESSAVAASAALCEDEMLLGQTYLHTGLTHSQTLLPMAAGLLEQCGLKPQDLDLIAVAAGPGSFTGLRIGVAAAKGLAWAAELPCAGCSTLEAMAWRGAALLRRPDRRRHPRHLSPPEPADAERLGRGPDGIRTGPDRPDRLPRRAGADLPPPLPGRAGAPGTGRSRQKTNHLRPTEKKENDTNGNGTRIGPPPAAT